ncbi:lipoate--protein ligase family protein [Corynebacterium sp. 3HC-13]|uniref:lipoyl protein ligase domain-containing protein n=1 Tax=Corynebacterium poyangense TaxID=2684405 RepID=UPI001CCD2A1B|nr:lipoate--protein ligase family protein [Corynebacterium poyangense]MBZ8176996.1 lipoate--protein ligase family protein [Corynebacterium poyangense]
MTEEISHYHSALKVPGGKLVVADVTATSSHLQSVQISGDFFLEPEEAFEALGPALEAASVQEDTTSLIKRLDAALSTVSAETKVNVELHGLSTRDIAQVVRRALNNATDFSDHSWEIIHSPVLPTPMNVALDELILNQVAAGQRGPTLRLWEWNDRAAVIGSYQSYVNELDPDGVRENNVTVVRRISGGGAMFMEGGNCITYSLYAPDSLVAGLSYEDSYEYLDRWVLAALAKHGVHAWYMPINDITSSAGKIGGAAQKRRGKAVLHHVTMSYDIDAEMMTKVLRIAKVKIADKGIRSASKRVDPLRSQTGATRSDIISTLIDTFKERYSARSVELSESDLQEAQHLVDTKFGTEEWTHRLP